MIGETKINPRLIRKRRSGWLAIFRRLLASRDGAVGTEHGFLLAFIALVAAIGFVSAGDGLVTYFDGVSRVVERTAADAPNPLGGGGSGGSSSGGGTTTGGTTTGGTTTGGTTTGGTTTGGGNGGSNGNGGGNSGGSNGGGSSGGGSSNGNGNGNK